jgi:hypothetical protein
MPGMQPLRLAMWSGPRNISTAMMRAWGNRPDTIVCDEPLYAHYLQVTGVDHPGREEVIASHDPDWRRVVSMLTVAIPVGKAVFYQKHMAHHLTPDIDRTWLRDLTNCFLIRDPREMLLSLIQVTPRPALEDTGLPQQVEILERVSDLTGTAPPVIDARDVLLDPRGMLGQLCRSVGIAFHEAMLHWPAGSRATDGVWARHWYDAVNRSTGFEPYRPRPGALPPHLAGLLDQCMQYYERLQACRLRPSASS